MPKFMQSLGTDNYARLLAEAKTRDVTVQALIRTVIVPEWLKAIPTLQASLKPNTATALTVQPPTMLARTGVLSDQPRRPFLNTTLGRVRS